MTQRPLLLDVMEQHDVALVRVDAPKALCMERVAQRNVGREIQIKPSRCSDFFDFWTGDVALGYDFALTVDGSDADLAIGQIRSFVTSG